MEKLHVRRRPRALPRVLNLFPRYSRDPEGPEYEQYCRVKLMLHHPFSEPSELRMLDEDGVFSYATAYRLCRAEHEHPRDPLDPLEVEDEGESESEFESERDEAEPEPQAAWTDLAARNGRHDAQLADASDLENILGKRPQDIAYNWHASDHLYERVGEQRDFFEQARLLPEVTNRIRNDPSTLQGSQRTAFDTIIDHYRSCFTGVASRQLLLHIDGSAGTGKSYLIDMTSTYLFDMAQRNGHQDPVIRAAPTGVAAFGIQGQTLHRLLRLPVRKRFEPLSNSVLLSLQLLYASCRYLIIDEKSMIGLPQLYYIDSRLRQIFPAHSDTPFGGLNIIMCGDFYQLPPVGMSPLYDIKPAVKAEIIQAQSLYQCFDRTIQLTRIMRQQGEDEESVQFRTLLEGLRHGNITDASYELLLGRVYENLAPDVRDEFRDALRIYGTRAAVHIHNLSVLERNG